jgi:glycosyltransferase involved in cell wall biosynthesis
MIPPAAQLQPSPATANRKSIVFVSSVFDRAREGPAIYAHYLWEHFSRHAYFDFHLVTPESSIRDSRIHVSGAGTGSLDTYERLQRKALAVAHELGAGTVVHGNAAHSMYRFRDYKGPLILQVNDYDPAEVYKDTLGYLVKLQWKRYLALCWRRGKEAGILKRADLILCNSGYTHAAVLRSYKPDAKRCRVLYKAVATENFVRPAVLPADPFPGMPGQNRLVFVGTNWRRKGLDVLLRALKQAVAKIPQAQLVVIGPEPDAELRALAGKYGVLENVHFAGRVARAELPNMLWHSAIAVLPSRKEALGVAVLEALAAGVAVVATRVGGIPEIIAHPYQGRLVEPEDSAALAETIIRLLSASGELERLARVGPARAAEFGREVMLGKLESIYRQLTERHEKPQP